MKKVKSVLKKNGKLLLEIVIGGILFGGGVYAAAVAPSSVLYNNSTPGLTSTNVQGALDEETAEKVRNFIKMKNLIFLFFTLMYKIVSISNIAPHF